MEIIFQFVTSFFWIVPFFVKLLIEAVFTVSKPFLISALNKCFKYAVLVGLFTEVASIIIKFMNLSRLEKYVVFGIVFVILNSVLVIVQIVLYQRNKWRPWFEFHRLNEQTLANLKADIHQFLETSQEAETKSPSLSGNQINSSDFITIERNQFLHIEIMKKNADSMHLVMTFKPDSQQEIKQIKTLMQTLNKKYRKYVKAPLHGVELKPYLALFGILIVLMLTTAITENIIPHRIYLILNVILVLTVIMYSLIQDLKVDNAHFYLHH